MNKRQTKKIMSWIICLITSMVMILSVYGSTTVANAAPTEEYVIKVKTAQDLAGLSKTIDDYDGKLYIVRVELENDIDMYGVNMNPIDLKTSGGRFMMIRFDGGNHTISNLKITAPKTDYESAGLFAEINANQYPQFVKNVKFSNFSMGTVTSNVGVVVGYTSGNVTIENIQVSNSNITAEMVLGGIVGSANGTTIKNCNFVSGKLSAAVSGSGGTVGGIVAYLNGGTVENCKADGNFTAQGGTIGGIAGCTNGKATISDCNISYSGEMYAGMQAGNIGVIAGENRADAVIKNCKVSSANDEVVIGKQSGGNTNGTIIGGLVGSNAGTIENCSTDIAVAGQYKIGGIAGVNTGLIKDCDASGDVKATITQAGGIAGLNSGTIINSDNKGDVTTGVAGVGGGVTGQNSDTGVIDDCTNTGAVKGFGYDANKGEKTEIPVDNVGGIAGINDGTIKDSTNESSLDGDENIGGVTGTNNGSLLNCTNNGDVDGDKNIGGLAGVNNGTIEGGKNAGDVTGNTNVGGIAGNNTEDGIIKDATSGANKVVENVGDVTGDTNIGGIAGINDGNISGGKNSGDVTGNTNVGGIAGQNKEDGLIEGSKNKGDVTGDTNVGGVVGFNNGTVKKTTNDGEVEGDTYVGGIAGTNNDNGSVTDSVNNGDVDGTEFVGGIIGDNAGIAKNNVNNGQVSGVNPDKTSGTIGENSGEDKNNESTKDPEQRSIKDGDEYGMKWTIDPKDGGIVYVTGYDKENVSVKPVANPGFKFDTWVIDGNEVKGEAISIKVAAKKEIIAKFTYIDNVKPVEGGEIVGPETIDSEKVIYLGMYFSCSPADGGKITLVSKKDRKVTVKAESNPGYSFDGWKVNGKVVSKDAQTTIDVKDDVNVIAVFKAQEVKNDSLFTSGIYIYRVKSAAKKTVYVAGSTTRKLTTIDAGTTTVFNGVTYKVAGYAMKSFASYPAATTVVISKSMDYIGQSAFAGSKNIKTVVVKSTSLTKVHKYAFKGCTSLTSINLAKNKKLKTIDSGAFSGCKKLKSVKLGKNVTVIRSTAFSNCSSLTSIVIPAKVSTIGKKAFYNCKKLKKITIKSKLLKGKKIGASAFAKTSKKAVVKVPASKKAAYTKLLKKKGLNKKAKIK